MLEPPDAAGRTTLFMTSRQRWCTSRTFGLHAVNFKWLHAHRHVGWAGQQGDRLVGTTRRSPRVSCYNTALSYNGDATSDAQHPHSPPPPCLHWFAALNETTARIRTLRWVWWNGRKDLVWISVVCERLLAHFSLISRDGNFPMRIVSYDNLVYDRCHTFTVGYMKKPYQSRHISVDWSMLLKACCQNALNYIQTKTSIQDKTPNL